MFILKNYCILFYYCYNIEALDKFNTVKKRKGAKMKKILKQSMSLVIVAMLVMFSTGGAFAAGATDSATATTTAIIIAPLSISVTQDLHFGEIAQPILGGTAIVDTSGVSSTTGDVSYANTSLVTNASFSVSGQANTNITITLPGTYNVTSGSDNMAINTFVSSQGASTTLDSSGDTTIDVGATLVIGANQPEGTYTNNTGLVVTVSY